MKQKRICEAGESEPAMVIAYLFVAVLITVIIIILKIIL